jgi:hypothetical protein
MRVMVVVVVVLGIIAGTPVTARLAPPPPVVVTMGEDRFEITAEGNAVTGLRWAPVPYDSVTAVTTAVRQLTALPTAVRLTRMAPPQVIDYVWCVTEDGALLVGRQVRILDARSDRYHLVEGDIKRAYRALEATVPWTWIVEIPLGRETALTLEVRATTATWPVRSVTVTPRVR